MAEFGKQESVEEVLNKKTSDYIARFFQGGLSCIPYAGPIIAEFVTDILPKQRLDRIADYLKQLSAKLKMVDATLDKLIEGNEIVSRFIEESIRQAANSSSFERRAYLASIIALGINKTDLELQHEQFLLNMLGQINDIEIIVLNSYSKEWEKGLAYRRKHQGIFFDEKYLNSQEYNDSFPYRTSKYESSIYKSYSIHLESLCLLYDDPECIELKKYIGEEISVVGYNYSTDNTGSLIITDLGNQFLERIKFGNNWLE